MQTINLDLSVKGDVPILRSKQGDVGRKFKITLTDNGLEYEIPAHAVVSVWYSGTSGEGNYTEIAEKDAVIVDGNTITVEMITQMVKNKGGGVMCLILHLADGTQLGMWNIPYITEPVPGFDSDTAEQHYTALSKVMDEMWRTAAALETDTSLSVSDRPADAKATGEALAGKAPAEYIYESHNGGDANHCLGDFHKLCINFENVPSAHGFLDVSYANGSGFLVNDEKPIILQEMTPWDGNGKYRRCSTDNGNSWSQWESIGLMAYPVGAIYLSVNEISPSSLFGGSWERLKDRFLLGAGDNYLAGSVGGNATHILTENELPAHSHSTNGVAFANPVADGVSGYVSMRGVNYSDERPEGAQIPQTLPAGSGAAHNNMPPYIAVFMWKRIA